MIKLFATDIDHTLYCAEKDLIPQENVDAINKLMDSGVTLCLASSRNYEGIQTTIDLFDLRNRGGYCIALNGSYVVSLKDNRVLLNEHFQKEEIEQLYHASIQSGFQFGFLKGNTAYATAYSKILDYDMNVVGMDVVLSKNILKYADGIISQLSFIDDNRNMYEAWKNIDPILKEKYNFNVSQTTVIDISLKRVNKYNGLKKVLEDMHITNEELAATGDNDNDIPMLQAAKISGCVANGSENAKRAASVTVRSDGEAGVSQFILENLL